MVRILISLVIRLGASAVGLLVAAWILDDMTVDPTAFLIAVALFTGVLVLVQPLITSIAVKQAPVLMGGTALVATLVSLIVTTLISDGLSITGLGTWVAATVIVWLAALLAGLLLPLIFVKSKVADSNNT